MGDDRIRTMAEAAEDHALPRCHEVHAAPDARRSGRDVTEGVALSPADGKSPAEWAYERVILYIRNFEKSLDDEHEIAMGFTGADAGVIRIEGVGYFDPDVITFYGSDTSGIKTQLIQHVGQLNVMLRALPKRVKQAEPTRIGFQLAQDLEKG